MRTLVLAGVLLASAPYSVRAADWKTDAGASRLDFATTFEKTPVPGVFKEFDARMHFDADKPGEGRLDVTIAVKSADMSIAEVNKAIAGAEWFDFARFPQAEFHANEIHRTEANRYVARGILGLKGVQRPIEVPFAFTETGAAARIVGEFTVQRGTFGIGTGEWAATSVIGADVKIRFDVKFTQDR